MSATEYATYLFFKRLGTAAFDQAFGNEWIEEDEVMSILNSEMTSAFLDYGVDVGPTFHPLVQEHFNELMQNSVLFAEGDNYTGRYYKISSDAKRQFFKRRLENMPVARRISVLGEPALRRALKVLAGEHGWLQSGEVDETSAFLGSRQKAPASDRVVTFSDNQVADLEARSTELIDALSKQNQIAETPGLRELILGQLKAGRELIRAGSVRLFLLQVTLLDSLAYLAKKYDGEIVGALAGQLIEALLNLIGIDT